MCIVICIIYVHDDVNVFAYEYVNVCVNDNDSYYCMCICIQISLLHDLRIERRKYKDEQIIADVMKSGFSGSNWELVRTRVDDLKDRQYHVRNLEELFK